MFFPNRAALLCLGIVAWLSSVPSRAAIPESETAALHDLYDATGGQQWTNTAANLQRWFIADPDPCRWFGIQCDAQHEHVTVLALGNDHLVGTLPASLGHLTKLRAIVLDHNELGGPIPSLAGLGDLEGFIASYNELSGPVPAFADVPNLGFFAVDHNRLSGHIPASVSDLAQLQYFVIDHNEIAGRVPRAPAMLTAFSTSLCPNRLDPRPSSDPTIDAGWNLATGLAAWSSGSDGACVAAADATALRAFATSVTGTGDLHSWADVAGTNLTGLAAADAVCQARAAAANLADPGDYVAWLSDRDDDAYCRVFGLTGRKGDRCGLSATPTGAGPWLRTDDVPFADTIENALDANRVFSTLNVDEGGTRFVTSPESFTATDVDGTFNTTATAGGDCSRWSTASEPATSAFPALGSNVAAGTAWTFDDAGASCSTRQRLTCLQKGSGIAAAGHGRHGHREAFVTSAGVSGAFGGIAGADAICRDLATAARLYQPGSFKALLASSTLGIGIADRITFDGPWYRRDGLLFAHDKAELTGGAVTLPLNVTEAGAYLGTSVALTGAAASGAGLPGFDCSAWTKAGPTLTRGALVDSIVLAGSSGHNWLGAAEVSCAPPAADDWQHHLFCLSDIDVVFHGEFEPEPVSP